ncbi:hypothetical protein J1605_004732 [Eschrichtius robustus]|uniref:Uncharacterized protein n=1 Tax=Eschrichtius robustus TaxID=9764 RepID=A0AB34HGF8_ESCRO|nr:hypothetical protein J1605_004732 [Eschrichtius robustus]
MLPASNQERPEDFCVLSKAALFHPRGVERHQDQLLRPELVSTCRVFFNLTAEKVKPEQRLRFEAKEGLSVVCTKAVQKEELERCEIHLHAAMKRLAALELLASGAHKLSEDGNLALKE